jgi:hypothetical protein
MKVGDKVYTLERPGQLFTLVWYKKGDNTCAVANERSRFVVKTSTLSLAI